MMLQGHFVSALLAEEYRDHSNTAYTIWEYFRGITAPAFFTVTGFIFMYLILKQDSKEKQLLRVKKGIRRGLSLIFWGYLLRLGIAGLLSGYYHKSFIYTDVLHIIGLSIIIVCLLFKRVYHKNPLLFRLILISSAVFIFLFERYYNSIETPNLPLFIGHYATKAYGAVFSLFPWLGYVFIGGFLSHYFIKYQHKENFYFILPKYLGIAGLTLIFLSTGMILNLAEYTGLEVLYYSGGFNYLFTRLGDVFVLMALFIYGRNILNHSIFIKIGKVTLSIYIVHHILLYGSWFHTGLYRWFYKSLSLTEALLGALAFICVVCFLVLNFRERINAIGNAIKLFIAKPFRSLRTIKLR